MRNCFSALVCLLVSSAFLAAQTTDIPLVRFHTNLGDIDVQLLPNSAPLTVANFLNYMNKGSYNNSVIHRSVPGFIIQGGGYQLINHSLVAIPTDPAVTNEYNQPNVRGTIAMAKLGTDPNSATDQWFFNLNDNSSILDVNNNGGFTVFGQIVNSSSLSVMDKIASVPVPSPGPLATPFDQIPLLNYSGGPVQDANYVVVQSVGLLLPFPVIATAGISSPHDFGGYPAAGPGSIVEIYGTNLAATSRSWAAQDFQNGNAPTTLDGVSVTVKGIPAYVSYVSPTQVNIQVPAGVPTDGVAPVILTYNSEASQPVNLSMRPYEGGLLAPASFKVGNTQYVAAIHASTGAFVTNGKIPGYPSAPAKPGETLIFYGVGFGPVTPTSVPVAGQIVNQANNLMNTVTFQFGSSTAQVTYAGLVQGYVGLYQINVVVPSDAPTGDVPVQVGLGVLNVPQTLYIPIAP